MTDTMEELEQEWHQAGEPPSITPLGVILAGDKLLDALKAVQVSALGWEKSAKTKQRTLARLTKENAGLRTDLKEEKRLHGMTLEAGVEFGQKYERLRAVLMLLVELKKHREAFGKDDNYLRQKVEAWELARKALEGDG